MVSDLELHCKDMMLFPNVMLIHLRKVSLLEKARVVLAGRHLEKIRPFG